MRKHHPENERIKHRYLVYLREAKRLSEASVDSAAAAIAAFDASTGYTDFKRFKIDQARRFKTRLGEAVNEKTGRPLSKATVHSRLMAVKAFFIWLADKPGYRSRISFSDAEYFNPAAQDSRIANAVREQDAPTIEQIRKALDAMPAVTEIERRDRALLAFTLLTGVRDGALISLRLRHVELDKRRVVQDPREVKTKLSKLITTTFFPVGDDIEALVGDWVAWLKVEKGFGPDDPLFPKTRVGLNEDGVFGALGLTREHWASAAPVRKVFREAFERAGLPYFKPHSFRHTLGKLGETVCRTPEEFKAWSQNLGHDQVMTTFTSYGSVSGARQAAIIAGLSRKPAEAETSAALLSNMDGKTLAMMAALVEQIHKKV